ncbi:MAG: DUF5343 domain-containing protein [Gemmatimonadota bacterium]|nr:DUF5343 domain-containing protein [Gemmatimonadota bacterium]
MASTLPYLPSYKNVGLLFTKIAAAKQPEAFNNPFLYTSLGLKGTADRSLIPLLRTLGFIDAASKPTSEYGALKNPKRAGAAIASAVRRTYAPLFDSNENAHKLSQEELKGLVAQVAGSDDDMTKKIVGTFNALVRSADFSATPAAAEEEEEDEGTDEDEEEQQTPKLKRKNSGGGLRPEFHYNIQVHLPANGTEDVYLSIFNALRRAFK